MKQPWDIKSLRELITAKHPETAKNLIRQVNSLARSKDLFDYHGFLARDAYKELLDADPSGLVIAYHSLGGGDQQKWGTANLQSEANLISCISTVVNAYETFGQLLDGLGLVAAYKGRFNIHKACKGLADGELQDLLSDAISTDSYKYLKAFTNTTKHHQLINHHMSLSFEDGHCGAGIESFEYVNYEGTPEEYPTRLVEDVLKDAVKAQSALLSCGKALNRYYHLHCVDD